MPDGLLLTADGYIDQTGKVVLPNRTELYWAERRFSEGFAVARAQNIGQLLYGFIDKAGNIAIPMEYTEAHSFNGGLARVEKDGKSGYIDKNGSIVVSIEYGSSYYFSNDAYFPNYGNYGYGTVTFFISESEYPLICKYSDTFFSLLALPVTT